VSVSDFDFIRRVLKRRSGLSLSPDKEYLVQSRLMPLVHRAGLDHLPALMARIRAGDEAITAAVVEAMITNETFFFRDRLPFEHVRESIVPALLAARARHKRIRIWCAAASTGQEPYSIAMALKEMGPQIEEYRIEILATDICNAVLDRARAGIYNQFEVQRGLPIHLLLKYFRQSGEQWQLDAAIRNMVQFRTNNLLEDFAGLGTFDLVICRNVLIYFDAATKSDVLDRMAQVVAPDGYLILGAAETTVGLSKAFRAVRERRGLYVPVRDGALRDRPLRDTALRGAATQAANTISPQAMASVKVGSANPSRISNVVEITGEA
jgi:chemotaxis protein methyltransferase CheR